MIELKKWSFITHSVIYLIIAFSLTFNLLETIDYRTQDVLYQTPQPTHSDIVIIVIDDDSLNELGKWPWPRSYHSELLHILLPAKPAAIGYDVIFAETSTNSADDAALVDVVKNNNDIVFPVYGTFPNHSGDQDVIQAINMTKPFTSLANVSETGHINTLIDRDGIVRNALFNFSYENDLIDSFSWTLYKLYEEKNIKDKLSIKQIPLTNRHMTPIRYSGEPHSFEMIPFHDVLKQNVPAQYFENKIVLIGPTAIGLADDYYYTPLAPNVAMYGVEIHANIIQQFMTKQFWKDVPLLIQLFILLVIALINYLVFNRYKLKINILFLFLLIGTILLTAKQISTGANGYIFSFIHPIGLIGLQFFITIIEKFIAEQIEKNRVKNIFGKYVAPQIVHEILKSGEDGLRLGGSRKDITVLFVDIRGFTPLSESAQPEDVVNILNEYLTLCANAIFEYDGTLDKYIGDAVMAIYNAPVNIKNHPLQAVKTANMMIEKSLPLQKKLKEQYDRDIAIGIGIHTGPAIVGNVGANFRMDYTAIGDTVNTAARIESKTKGGQILISEDVYKFVHEHIIAKDKGEVILKGKEQPLRVYEVSRLK